MIAWKQYIKAIRHLLRMGEVLEGQSNMDSDGWIDLYSYQPSRKVVPFVVDVLTSTSPLRDSCFERSTVTQTLEEFEVRVFTPDGARCFLLTGWEKPWD